MTAPTSKAELFRTLRGCRHVITEADERLLGQILEHDGGAGCWAAVPTLADECGLGWSPTKVKVVLRRLHAVGFIRTVHERGGSRADPVHQLADLAHAVPV